ncbi:type I polyketide synthase [Kineosporia sp. NBRC 101677]|uniref:type I polyketide synthase n=1 Tax=Kineosporia sp. NBRC 101677 TaxID=3032197 RepID=UPI002553B647|nr:type I polyketide synthase [Kineosporia sp. NBRC 101677]
MDSQEKLFDYLKRASAELQETRKRLRRMEAAEQEPIAIISLGCRYPGGVSDPESFWQLLESGTDAVAGLPTDRGWENLRPESLGEDEIPFAPVGGFLYDAAKFDPAFFGISPREALAMDPQQRLMLEVAWESLERAQIDPRSLRGSSTGVYVGAGFAGYGEGLVEADSGSEGYLLTGSQTAMISGRVSYTLGLEGPSVTLDTACSSSLVALHLACQALRSGDCSMALAGGVVVMVTPAAFAEFTKQQGMAADGRSKAFAAASDGMGWGEGAGILVLERLSDARRNGHPVLAVIEGSAANQDGASNGLTAPNGPSQQRVIREALANARVRTDQVAVVEAHGTGTTLGDPIEAQALLATYGSPGQEPRRTAPLRLGSVKSNIGHTQAAGGVAGVIKMVLALQNQQMPQTLHIDAPTPQVDWSAGEVSLLTEPVAWPSVLADGGAPRRAGVSAFGASGTNVHVILAEAPAAAPSDEDAEPAQVAPAAESVLSSGTAWLLSGRTADALSGQAHRLAEFCGARDDVPVVDLGWSLATTRSVFEQRAVVVGTSREELLSGVSALAAGEQSGSVVRGVPTSGRSRSVFVFPGQGSQWVGMGRALLAESPVFAARLAECAAALAPYVDWNLLEELDGPLQRVDVVQPVLWAVNVSLAAVWEAAGVKPDAVVGHSQGEIAAAVVSGALSLEDGARVVALRSQALKALSGRGGMLSIAEPVAAVQARLVDGVTVAAVNGPNATVVSGDPALLQTLAEQVEAEGGRARMLPVDYASHGPQVDELKAEILRLLEGITPQTARIPMVSAMTGLKLEGTELTAQYWYDSLRARVEFSRAVEALAQHRIWIEVSAHPVLASSVLDILEAVPAAEGTTRPAPIVTGTLRRDEGGATRLLASLAEVHVNGGTIDWAKVLPAGRRVDLPTYAFQRQHFWPIPAPRQTRTVQGLESPAQEKFWNAVETGDVAALADTLALDGQRLEDVVPALASWRRRERDDSATADWRYRITWVPVPGQSLNNVIGTWLLVTPANEAGQSQLVQDVTAALTARGAHIVHKQIDTSQTDPAVVAAQFAGTDTPSGVLSLLSLDETRLAGHVHTTGGSASTLTLVRALGLAGIEAPLWLMTSGAMGAAPGETPANPPQAQAWGLGRVAGLEHPERWGGLIDLPTTLDSRSAEHLVTALTLGEDQLAVRPSGLLARRLTRADGTSGNRSWSPRGTVLVTGASGEIGPELARWLAAAGAQKLVLISRRGPSVAGAAEVMAALAAAGTTVSLITCDVTDKRSVAALLDHIDAQGPALSSVIHGALNVNLQPLTDTDVDQLDLALGAKVTGALNLDELTAERDLDAFVLFSSIAATWGVLEHGSYAAANAHLDALAQNRRARGLPATSVAWGVWDTGQESEAKAGVERALSVDPERLRRQGLRLLEPARALTVLGQVLADDETAVAVADVDWKRFSAVFNAVRSWPLLQEIPEARQAENTGEAAVVATGEAADLLGRLSGASVGQRERTVTELVRQHAAAVLGFGSAGAVEADRAFRDMGFDSLTAVELRTRLNQATGLQLPSTVVFDYPTPLMLARQIIEQLLGSQKLLNGVVATRGPVTDDPIVLVGMGCRFPGGVDSPQALWRMLADGGDAIGGFPDDRGWNLEELLDGSAAREGGFMSGAADFDANFFRISPREALAIDPQQRLLLETSWQALESAGLDPNSLRGSLTGVFAGAASSGYSGQAGFTEDVAGHLITGNVTSVISGRVSYALGLEGPAVTVDTACSSALVSLHLAAQALRGGECDLALAGGVMVITDPGEFIGFSQQGALALDGRCKAFSADADGMGLAEGVGMVVLERLSDARRNGHEVLAVIAGSAVNQDGASNGLSAPNGPSQQRVIRAALASAGLSAVDVDAVEGHGTGTKLGDPIEAQALLATYGQERAGDQPLWLGSVKSNIGHAQQAAGVAGVIKMVLALQHGLLPASLHAGEPSDQVDWSSGAVSVLTESRPWAAGERVRRAGVSAFGISGTNAHLILEEPPAAEVAEVVEVAGRPGLVGETAWLVSSRAPGGLAVAAGRLLAELDGEPASGLDAGLDSGLDAGPDPVDVGWSLATTRSTFEHRAVVTGELREGLQALASGLPSAAVVTGTAAGVGQTVFVFPGQGSQWVGMGRALAAVSPVFAERLNECAVALSPFVEWNLFEELAGSLERVDVVQPVLWAVNVSLAAVWEAAGVRPDAVVGHSQGEIAAAVVSGALSLEDGARVVALRSQALKALAGRGGMLSIAEPVAVVEARLSGDVTVAAVNGPSATVVSGDPVRLAELLAEVEGEGGRARMLPVDYASHGPQVDELQSEILRLLAEVKPRAARIPMVSAMTGEHLTGTELTAQYWYDSLRAKVEFARAVEVLADEGYGVFIESSAHPVLTAPIADILDEQEAVVAGTLRREDGGADRMLASLAEVHVRGVHVEWPEVLPAGRRVALPTYAFERQRYWPKATPKAETGAVLSAEESAFWSAVSGGDLNGLAQTLAVDEAHLREVLPALAAWREREQGESVVAPWRYRITWTPVATPATASRTPLSGTWLLVAPAGSVEAAGLDAAEESGAVPVQVARALAQAGAALLICEVAPGEVSRDVLRTQIAAAGQDLAGVVSLLALEEAPLATAPIVPTGLAATTSLIQALGDAGVQAPLWVLTTGAVSTVAGEPASNPVQARTWALGRVAALEFPTRWGGLVDLQTSSIGNLAAVLAGTTGEDQVALRDNGIHARRLVRAGRAKKKGAGWTPRGTVLITGGTGGVGGHISRWLSTRGAQRVVLTSRSGATAAGTAALAAQLAQAGTSVAVLSNDIGDREQVENLLAWIGRTGPALSSVLHAAGAPVGGPLEEVGLADLERALQAKVGGAELLDELTEDLDAFVMFSSGAATWGSGRLSAYAAGNAALDALVEQRRARGEAGTSAAWGLWGGGGMGEGYAGELLQRLGLREMDPAPAVAALAQIMDAGEDLVTVADIDWDKFATLFTVQRPSRLLADIPDAQQQPVTEDVGAQDTALLRQLRGLSDADAERVLTDLVRGEVAAVLGHSSGEVVLPTRPFKDLGFDSLTAVDLRTRLNTATGLKLPATLVFDHPTVAAVVQLLRSELLGELTELDAHAPTLRAADLGEPIAIVGMGCKFPGGVNDPEGYWRLMAEGIDAISPFPTDRNWDSEGLYSNLDGTTSETRVGGFLYDAGYFDPEFFGISPREAVTLDPQQRLLLETAYEAVERAGIDPAALKGTPTGVFVGAGFGGYGADLIHEGGHEGYMLIGALTSVISGRISYTLGLEGPAVTVDTACSSALVAMHQACQALRAGEISMALTGGVAVMATPSAFAEFSRQDGLAFDGRSKAFAADADGIGWGEGAGIIVLERLSDARRNGHQVLAVIAGSAMNQDGASNGITAPHGPSQQRVIRAALASAGLRPDEVDAVEAHGTGTALGDPIEAQALLATYGRNRPEGRPLWLGSVKSNIGHTQTASGVASVIKLVLALQNQQLPRTLHAAERTPQVDWSVGDVELLNEAVHWPSTLAEDGRARRAGVSSFGVSGTNVHAIIEEAPVFEELPTQDEGQLAEAGELVEPAVPVLTGDEVPWLVSARSGAALAAQAARVGGFLRSHEREAAEVAWSLLASRSLFEHRAVVIGSAPHELLAGLGAVAGGEPAGNVVTGAVPIGVGIGKVAFVFPGQGSQWIGMGRALLADSPVFAARMAECAAALSAFVEWNLLDELAGPLERVDVVQPVLWAVNVSLAAVWEAAGVRPDAVVGHSQGEIAAAVVSGALSLEDGARVVALRSQALRALSGRGGMLSIAEPVAVVEARLTEGVTVAAVNGPNATVVSGDPAVLEVLAAQVEAEGGRARMLPVDYASHGPQVDELREEILRLLDGVMPQTARIPMVSAMTGLKLDGTELTAQYWYDSLRAKVEFAQAIQVLGREHFGVFIESSAHPVLTNPVTDTLEKVLDGAGALALEPVVVGTLRREDGGAARMLASLAEVHVRGVEVDWTRIVAETPIVELPTYAFQRRRYWPNPAPAPVATPAKQHDDEFWDAVESGDLEGLAGKLAIASDDLEPLLPALAGWRHRERDESLSAAWRYRITWVPMPDAAPAPLSGTWVLVVPDRTDASELADALKSALSERGAQVVLCSVPTDKVSRAAIGELLADRVGEQALAGVISLMALAEEPLPGQVHVPTGTAGLLALAQALGDLGVGAPLWALTRGGVGTDHAPTNPVQAQTWGLGRTIGVEHPDRWGGLVDLPEVFDERAATLLVGALQNRSEDQVAIRPGGLLARRLVRATPRKTTTDIKNWAQGSVLITGASGAIGPDLTAWLVEAGVQHLVLTTRRGPQTPGAATLAASLAEAGATVTMVACDVTSKPAMQGLLDHIPTVAPKLSMVIHSAVAVELMAADVTGVDDLALALGAKVGGAQVLDELTAELDLAALVFFSSITATWGVGEHATYAAANAHLDALAENRRARGLPATSIAWGVWGSGGRFDDDNAAERPLSLVPERLRRQGLSLLEPQRALGVFGQVLADDETVLSVADVDWDRFSAVFSAMRSWPLLNGVPEARQIVTQAPERATGEGGALQERLRGLSAGQQERIVTDLVSSHAAAVLGFTSGDSVQAAQAFRDMGFDSLTAVELRSRLNQATGLQLPTTVVFDYPSPVVLARQIVTELTGTSAAVAQSRVAPIDASDPIVIVGMGCRYPGGIDSPAALWKLLDEGGDAIGGFPADRGWDLEELRETASATREGGFMSGAADFDPAFFRISPREALAMDPQQRLLLETSWEAMENAGIAPTSLQGSLTGVFAGAAGSGYAAQGGFDAETAGHLITGNVTSVISGRISYTLGLEGPAVTVDTACSSALVALHLAAQALRAGECDLALAGGVMVIADPSEFIGFSQQGALAADGRSKAFSAEADGMGLSEGAGMIVLERLSDARRNGHPVLAMVAGSAINQDGASNGLSAPNGPSQQRVIRAALASAGLSAADVDAVEAHGTGTRLGDPIEAQALLATYGQDRPAERPLWLGAVKSNIGHSQQASGAAGIMKMVMALQHGRLPATLHAATPSPQVDWSAGNVRLLHEPVDWKADPSDGHVRRAGVSAFGISGTNAHIILAEPPAAEEIEVEDEAAPVVSGPSTAWLISAQSAPALHEQAARLVASVHGTTRPVDIGWSLATTRSTFEHRAVVTGSSAELLSGLEALAAGLPSPALVTGAAGAAAERVVFVFPGQGSQWAGMGRALAASSPVFAERLNECAVALSPFVEWNLLEELQGSLERVDVVQPVLWAVHVSLAAVWEAAGVSPDAVVGHSQGEIAAAVVSGALSLEDGARVVALRSQALKALAGRGAMLSIAEPVTVVEGRLSGLSELSGLSGDVTVAAVNGPGSTVVSGDAALLQALAGQIEAEGGRARMLPVDYASHGPQVDELQHEILRVLAEVKPQPARVPMVSALTGAWLEGTELDARYWYDSLRNRVEFSRAIEVLSNDGYGAFVESSAHPVLTAGIIDLLENLGHDEPVVTGTLRREDGGADRLLAALASVHVRGIAVDWASVLPKGEKVALPTYAFQRRRYWPEPVPGTRRERPTVSTADWRYRVTWAALPEPQPAQLFGTWLLVVPTGSGALAEQCAQALMGHGAEVQVLEAGGVNRAALATRLTEAASEEPFAGVLSLLALNEKPMAELGSVPQGLAGTMVLAQALGDSGITAPLWVLTTEAVSTVKGEVKHPRQAETQAFARVIGLEHPDRWGGLVDVPSQWDPTTAPRLAAALTAVAADGGEDQIAIREEGLFGRRLVRITRPATQNAWTPAGTVLVTGGTGGVGGHVSRWLSDKGARRIVLSSRSGPNASGAVALAVELAERGTEATIVGCDIGERGQTAAMLKWIDGSGPALSSVMHAAGAGLAGPVEGMVPAELEGSLKAKAVGAMHLDELTSGLDAFVVFSSGAATWGSGQLSGYAAANGALDVLVENRRARGEAGTSVAWGLWGGGGMGEGLAGDVLQRMGMREMDPRVAVGALAEVMADGEDVVAVADIDWDRFAPVFTAQRPSRLLAEIAEAQAALGLAGTEDEAASGSALSERLEGLDRAGQQEFLTDLVRAEAAAVLGYGSVADVPGDRPFKDLGFDSLTAVDLRTRLNAATGLKLPATLVFDYPTPAVLADFVRSRAVDEKSDYALALAEVKKLELVVARASWDATERQDLTARLEALGLRLRGEAPTADIDRELESATDDEMFDLVEAELRDVDFD